MIKKSLVVLVAMFMVLSAARAIPVPKVAIYFFHRGPLSKTGADVEKVTGTPQYNTLFTDDEENTYIKISRTYKGTKRSSPKRLWECLSKVSSSKSDLLERIKLYSPFVRPCQRQSGLVKVAG